MTKLMIPLEVHYDVDKWVKATALVDTGCEVNLIRKSLIPPQYFQPAREPARFWAANQTRMSGGSLEADLIFKIHGSDVDSKGPTELAMSIECYDADIAVDVILSYQWMASAGIDIIPRNHGLMVQTRKNKVWVDGLVNSPPPDRSPM